MLLKMVADDGHLIGVMNWFAVHGTSMNNTNTYISGDNKGFIFYVHVKQCSFINRLCLLLIGKRDQQGHGARQGAVRSRAAQDGAPRDWRAAAVVCYTCPLLQGVPRSSEQHARDVASRRTQVCHPGALTGPCEQTLDLLVVAGVMLHAKSINREGQ